MKHETSTQIVASAPALAGAATAWSLQDSSTLAALVAASATALYVLFQTAFLLRKWYLLERRVRVPETTPAILGD